MKFSLLNESVKNKFIFRGVGNNVNPTQIYFGGKFYSDNPMDASNYGDSIQVYSISSNAKLYKGESSVEYCKQNELMFYKSPILDKINHTKILTLEDAYEDLIFNGEDPNLGLALFQSVAREHLESDGYSGAEWTYEDEMIPHQFQIWDDSILTFIEELPEEDATNKY